MLRTRSLFAVALLLVSACSSTSDKPTDVVVEDDGGVLTTGTPVPALASADAALPQADGRPAPRSSQTGQSEPDPKVAVQPPVKKGEILIGFEGLADTTSAGLRAAGVTAPTTSELDQQRQFDAVADHINKHGGLLGRKIKMTYHFTDVAGGGAFDARDQETCTYFTEDKHVFALVMRSHHGHLLGRCMAKHRTPLIDMSNTLLPYDRTDLNAIAPYLYLTVRANLSRFAVYIDALAKQGFFKGDTKVGLLRYDYPTHTRTLKNVIIPSLARYGVKLTDEFAFSVVKSVGELGFAANQATSASVRFRSKGINRVLFLPSAQILHTVWTAAAEAQNYRPRISITSWDTPDYVVNNAPAAQLVGAVGVGWQPFTDLGPERGVKMLRGNKDWGACEAVGKKGAFPPEFPMLCTPFLFMQKALARGPSVTALGLRKGADLLGSATYSNHNFGTSYVPNRFDGVGEARYLAYREACDCFDYTSGRVPVP